MVIRSSSGRSKSMYMHWSSLLNQIISSLKTSWRKSYRIWAKLWIYNIQNGKKYKQIIRLSNLNSRVKISCCLFIIRVVELIRKNRKKRNKMKIWFINNCFSKSRRKNRKLKKGNRN